MLKSSLVCFPFFFDSLASSGVWLHCIPVQYNYFWVIHLLHNTGQNCWKVCQSINSIIFEELIPGLPLFSLLPGLVLKLFSPQSVRYSFLVYANFDVVLEFKGASSSEGLCQFAAHLFLNAKLASRNFRHMSEIWYIFFSSYFSVLRYCNSFFIYLLPGYQCLARSYSGYG